MEPFILIIALFLSSIIGGIIFRWRGGGEPVGWGKYMPRPVDQILFSAPYIAIAFIALDTWQAAILSAITVIMVSKGHGDNMDLGRTDARGQEKRPEWYEFLIGGLYGKISNYWYDVIGMSVSGFTYTFPLGLMIANPEYGYFYEGLVLALSGLLKGPAYMLGFWLAERNRKWTEAFDHEVEDVVRFDGRTSYGEYWTGALLWPFAVYVLYVFARGHGYI